MINRKYKSVANHEYSRLPYMVDDGFDDVQRSTSQKYIQDNYGKFDESENQQSYKNDDDYQALEYNYSLPQFDIDGNLSGSDIDFAATTDKKIDCDEYWNELFPGHPTGTGPFIPSSNELYNLGIYSKKCPVEYKRQVCCGRGLRIQGPVNGELCSEENFSFSIGNKPKDCEYDFWARKGVMKSWGDYTAPYVTEDTEDTLGIYPWTGVSGTPDTNCLTWKVKIKVCEECKGVIGYTTLQMSVSQTQTLTVVGWKAGEVYSWETTSGSINPSTGNSVTYTAPASNANCASNPTITLTCGGSVVDTITMAVNAVVGYGVGWYFTYSDTSVCPACSSGYCQEIPGKPPLYLWNPGRAERIALQCSGSTSTSGFSTPFSGLEVNCGTAFEGWKRKAMSELLSGLYPVPPAVWDSWYDNRSEVLKGQGCCPAQLT